MVQVDNQYNALGQLGNNKRNSNSNRIYTSTYNILSWLKSQRKRLKSRRRCAGVGFGSPLKEELQRLRHYRPEMGIRSSAEQHTGIVSEQEFLMALIGESICNYASDTIQTIATKHDFRAKQADFHLFRQNKQPIKHFSWR